MAAGRSAPAPWYQRGSFRYRCRSSDAALTAPTKPSSVASASSRSEPSAPSRATGSPSTSTHSFGSIAENRLLVGGCQDQRRLCASSSRGFRASGSTVRTVNRRIALTWGRITGPRRRPDIRRAPQEDVYQSVTRGCVRALALRSFACPGGRRVGQPHPEWVVSTDDRLPGTRQPPAAHHKEEHP